MSFLQNMFGCCGRDKNQKKSDVEINIIKCGNENNTPPTFSTKNSVLNSPSITHNIPLITSPFLSNKKIDLPKISEEDINGSSYIEDTQQLANKINDHKKSTHIVYNNKSKIRATQTVDCKKNQDKTTVLSISDLSFVSENNNGKKMENYSKLLLSGDLFFGKTIIINDCGMINSKRNKQDGYTVFGLTNSVDISGNLNSDFIINFKRDKEQIGNIETESGKVFEIKFNKKKKEYTLFFINPFLYLYYKINNFLYFYQGIDYFLFVGKIFISVKIERNGNVQIINIQVDNTNENIKNVNEINQKFTFSENQTPIRIGRMNCDINITEQCISKVHGIIEFSKINQIFYYKNMSSSNGTTLLIKKGDFLKIKGEMNFKLEDVTFKIQEIP
jgi:hypothetical protein